MTLRDARCVVFDAHVEGARVAIIAGRGAGARDHLVVAIKCAARRALYRDVDGAGVAVVAGDVSRARRESVAALEGASVFAADDFIDGARVIVVAR